MPQSISPKHEKEMLIGGGFINPTYRMRNGQQGKRSVG
jgi:hypothetical protein